MKEITEAQYHIRLVTEEELDYPWPTMFWKTIQEVGPDDIVKPLQVYDELGKSQTVYLRHYQDYNGQHVYEVPLKRNLVEKEAESIVFVWEQLFDAEMGDFIIETSTPYTGQQVEKEDDLFSRNNFHELAERIAREQHNRWLEKRKEAGWRFGPRFNKNEKTHPMLKSWEELPEEYKDIDHNFPSFLSGLLGEYGLGLFVKERAINSKKRI